MIPIKLVRRFNSKRARKNFYEKVSNCRKITLRIIIFSFSLFSIEHFFYRTFFPLAFLFRGHFFLDSIFLSWTKFPSIDSIKDTIKIKTMANSKYNGKFLSFSSYLFDKFVYKSLCFFFFKVHCLKVCLLMTSPQI